MISNVEINKSVDFEVNWEDLSSQPQDMNNVTFELYHYAPQSSAEVVASVMEPYMVSELLTDKLSVRTLNNSVEIESYITLELNIIVDQLEDLGCPPNEFVVPNTNSKVSIVNGRKVFALSSLELAALINLQASGYFAEDRDGFLVLKTVTTGSQALLEILSGTINPVIGVNLGQYGIGTETVIVQDISPTEMTHISLGKYVYSNLNFSETSYATDKRYYVTYKATDPNTLLEQNKEEDFILIKSVKPKLNYSFMR